MKRGFALPTVVITSVIMLAVLATVVQMTVASGTALDAQRYQQLAKSAAESGGVMARICLLESGGVPFWTAAKQLTPATDCSGNPITGRANTVMTEGTRLRTTFTVQAAQTANGFHTFQSVGKVEVLRGSTGEVWRTYEQGFWYSVQFQSVLSTKTASGSSQTCTIIRSETWCWGRGNSFGKLGDGTATTEGSLVPVKVAREAGVLQGKTDTDLAIGTQTACVVASGGVYCWGRNTFGQIGQPANTVANPLPKKVGAPLGNLTATRVAVGGTHACAIVSNGDVYCWGRNNEGQLGNGTTTNSSTPVKVSGLGAAAGRVVTDISTGYDSSSTCAVAGGAAYCWGANTNGELGIGTTVSKTTPQLVGGLLSGKTVTDIATATNTGGTNGHTCAIASQKAYCWGYNGDDGVLGNNSTASSSTPVAVVATGVLSAKNLTSIGVGNAHTCTLSTEPKVYCWGNNASGQLGNNQPSLYSRVPVAVTEEVGALAGRTITRLDVGGNRGCATATQLSFCWGLNESGQIGDGTMNNALVPTRASFLDELSPVLIY